MNKNTTFLVVISTLLLLVNLSVIADELDDYLLKKMADKRIPGLQIAVIQNNKIIKTSHYGISNIQDNIPVTENTVFTINSMTKSFTGVAIMQLVESGKLALSDKVSSYVTDLQETWQGVTIKQLLTHTSGLPDIMPGVTLISHEGAQASWELVKKLPILAKPNTQFKYTATNYLLLGKIIDRISNQPFTDFIKQNQLAEVGMKQTESAGFSHFQGVIPNQARGYTYYFGNELTTIQAEIPPFLRATAGMSSTAKEIAQWVIALQNRKLLDKSSSLKALWSPAILEDGKTSGFDRLLNGYALGWQVIGREEHPAIASVGGDRSALFIYPEDNLSIIVITNLMGANPHTFIDEIADFYIQDMSTINGINVASNILEKYIGQYNFSGFTLNVDIKDNRLSLLASGEGQEAFTLYAKSDVNFFAKVFEAEFAFKRKEEGVVQSLVMFQGGKNHIGTKVR